jgi:hypothetical protein
MRSRNWSSKLIRSLLIGRGTRFRVVLERSVLERVRPQHHSARHTITHQVIARAPAQKCPKASR